MKDPNNIKFKKVNKIKNYIFSPFIKNISINKEFKNIYFTKNEFSKISKRFNIENIKQIKTYNSNEKSKLNRKEKKLKKTENILIKLRKLSKNPTTVDIWDTSSKEKKLIIILKENIKLISVPKIWRSKKKYLLGNKRLDKNKILNEELKSILDKQIKGVSGFKKLYEYFSKYKYNNIYSKFGEVYYEGKESDDKVRKFLPGTLSAQLRLALGIGKTQLPPWVVNFHRFGLPPSYTNLDISYGSGVSKPSSDKFSTNFFYSLKSFKYWGQDI